MSVETNWNRIVNFDIRKLGNFVSIARHGSINSAAKIIGISQAGLMKNIAALEQQLNVELFRRNARGVLLTEEGKVFLRHAQLIIRQATRANSALRAVSELEDLELRIGVSSSWILQGVMPIVMVGVAQQSRPPRLRIITGESSQALIEQLQTGDLDMVVAAPTNLDDLNNITSHPVATQRQGLILRTGHPLTTNPLEDIAELLNEKWILGPPDSYFRQHLNAHFLVAGLCVPEPRFTTTSFDLMMSVVAETEMIGVSVNELIPIHHSNSITMLETPFTVYRQVSVLFREGDVLPKVVSGFSDLLKGALGQ